MAILIHVDGDGLHLHILWAIENRRVRTLPIPVTKLCKTWSGLGLGVLGVLEKVLACWACWACGA
jgi:hypothetical protein